MASRRPISVAMLALAVLASSRPLCGQEPASTPPSFQDVVRLLESPELKDQAWGAWWVADGKIEGLEPQLLENLRGALHRSGYWNQFVLDATLDALIRLGHNDVPVDVLRAVDAQRPPASEILAAASSLPARDVDGFLRTVLDARPEGWQTVAWLPAADLLLVHHAPGLVAAVLSHTTFDAYVVVCDPSLAPVPYRTRATFPAPRCGPFGGGFGGDWAASIPDPAYPPWVQYALVRIDRPDATTFIAGPTAATSFAYIRSVDTPTAPGAPVTTVDRLAVIGAAAPGVTLPSIEGEAIVIPWSDPASIAAATKALRDELRRGYSTLLARLHDAGALTADEASRLSVPNIAIRVTDRRKG